MQGADKEPFLPRKENSEEKSAVSVDCQPKNFLEPFLWRKNLN